MLLRDFKAEFLEVLLSLLWKQWSSLGVAGYETYHPNRVIDPEALLLFTASIARFDQRLFDGMFESLTVNERFINVQRLRTILAQEEFMSNDIISAVAGKLRASKKSVKWKKIAEIHKRENETVPLFYLKSGRALPVFTEADSDFLNYGFSRNCMENRGVSNVFTPKIPATLLLELRSLWGLSCRAETMLYLLANGQGTITGIAEQGCFSWRSIQDVLYEISHSGVISFSSAKKGRVYYLDTKDWHKILLKNPDSKIEWFNWPPLFRVLELVWNTLQNDQLLSLSPIEQAAELKRLMDSEFRGRIEKTGFGVIVKSDSSFIGEEYLEYWIKTIKELVTIVE